MHLMDARNLQSNFWPRKFHKTSILRVQNLQVIKMSEDCLQYCNISITYWILYLSVAFRIFSSILLSFLRRFFAGKKTCSNCLSPPRVRISVFLTSPSNSRFAFLWRTRQGSLAAAWIWESNHDIMMRLNLWRASMWLLYPVGSANYYSTDLIMEHLSLLFISRIRQRVIKAYLYVYIFIYIYIYYDYMYVYIYIYEYICMYVFWCSNRLDLPNSSSIRDVFGIRRLFCSAAVANSGDTAVLHVSSTRRGRTA